MSFLKGNLNRFVLYKWKCRELLILRVCVLCGIAGCTQVALYHSTPVLNLDKLQKHSGVVVSVYNPQGVFAKKPHIILQEGTEKSRFTIDFGKKIQLNELKGMNVTIWSQNQFLLIISSNFVRKIKVGSNIVLDYENEVVPVLLMKRSSYLRLVDYIFPLFMLIGGSIGIWFSTSNR